MLAAVETSPTRSEPDGPSNGPPPAFHQVSPAGDGRLSPPRPIALRLRQLPDHLWCMAERPVALVDSGIWRILWDAVKTSPSWSVEYRHPGSCSRRRGFRHDRRRFCPEGQRSTAGQPSDRKSDHGPRRPRPRGDCRPAVPVGQQPERRFSSWGLPFKDRPQRLDAILMAPPTPAFKAGIFLGLSVGLLVTMPLDLPTTAVTIEGSLPAAESGPARHHRLHRENRQQWGRAGDTDHDDRGGGSRHAPTGGEGARPAGRVTPR